MAQEVKIVSSEINKLSTIIRSSLAASNAAMDVGDFETSINAEAALVRAYNKWHALQTERRKKHEQ